VISHPRPLHYKYRSRLLEVLVTWRNIRDDLQRWWLDRPRVIRFKVVIYFFFWLRYFFSFSSSCTEEREELADLDRCEGKKNEDKEEERDEEEELQYTQESKTELFFWLFLAKITFLFCWDNVLLSRRIAQRRGDCWQTRLTGEDRRSSVSSIVYGRDKI